MMNLGLIGRLSYMRTLYCPIFEDLEFPKENEDYLDDGTSKCIIVGMRDWKGWLKKCKQKSPVYEVCVYSNVQSGSLVGRALDCMKSPKSGKNLQRPIISKLMQVTFQKQLKKLIIPCGLKECSGRSLHK
jgi:hypothetical protein